MAAATNARAAGTPAGSSRALAGNTQFILVGVAPAGAYQITRNGTSIGSTTAGPAGSFAHTMTTSSGDAIGFSLTGIQPVTPAAPASFAAAGRTDGCVVVSWNNPPTSDYVTDYHLVWGTVNGVWTDSVAVDRLDVVRSGTRSSHTRCGLASGTYYFALRAHNSFDRWSGLSSSASATISNQNTVGPIAPNGVAITEPSFGCARVVWTKVGDPTVTGYRVYFGTRPRSQGAYTDSLDAGNTASGQRCGLAAGTYYAAVRSYTGTGLISGWSKEVVLVARGVDVAAPTITQRSPAAGATNVALNAVVSCTVVDDKTGVEQSSVQLRINGQLVTPTVTAVTGGFSVTFRPSSPLAPNSTVQVQLTAADKATPANSANPSWSFQTGSATANDNTPPAISLVTPTQGASGVESRPTIEVAITDAGLGVDLTSIEFSVNGRAVTVDISGSPANTRVSYQPATAFPAGELVRVRVEACDEAATANCAGPVEFTFTVAEGMSETQTASIVPDGFWANDPNRPMEVRNIPRDWRVRIFDPTGTRVRQYESAYDGTTFSWDFTNDSGQRVAPAVYLVRVTDSAGDVQRSGRFLVQSTR